MREEIMSIHLLMKFILFVDGQAESSRIASLTVDMAESAVALWIMVCGSCFLGCFHKCSALHFSFSLLRPTCLIRLLQQ